MGYGPYCDYNATDFESPDCRSDHDPQYDALLYGEEQEQLALPADDEQAQSETDEGAAETRFWDGYADYLRGFYPYDYYDDTAELAASAAAGTIDWLSGEENIQSYQLPEAERFGNTFCSTCGGRVPKFVEQARLVFIPAGSLDDEPEYLPEARIFMGSKANWSCGEYSHSVPEFEEFPG